jgi:hypothetical protein
MTSSLPNLAVFAPVDQHYLLQAQAANVAGDASGSCFPTRFRQPGDRGSGGSR